MKISFCVAHSYIVLKAQNQEEIYTGERDSYFPSQVELTAC